MDYDLDDLEKHLSSHREIEFTYMNEKYSITRITNGFSFTRFYDSSSIQDYSNHEELLKNATIGDELLADIFKQKKVKVDVLY